MSYYTIDPVVNGQRKQQVVKVGDTLPVDSIIDYDGDSVPSGWEQVTDTYTNNGMTLNKIGNVVYCNIYTGSTATTNGVISTIPNDYKPTTSIFQATKFYNGSAYVDGYIEATNTGNLKIQTMFGANPDSASFIRTSLFWVL